MANAHLFQATWQDLGKRLDLFLAENLPHLSRSKIKADILASCCQIAGEVITKPDFKLTGSEQISFEPTIQSTSLTAEEGQVKIVAQDQDLAVIDKEPGLTVHPCPSCPEQTLIQRLLSYFPSLHNMDGLRPGLVHRLDKDTSGLIVLALNEETRLALTSAFAEHLVTKTYLALVLGEPEEQGSCSEPLGRHPTQKIKMSVLPLNRGGKDALTFWEKLWQAPESPVALLKVNIKTGRTHQIRVHLAHLNYPILGDQLYGGQAAKLAPRQMLHATKLEFTHPKTKEELKFSAPPPNDFRQTALHYAHETLQVVITGNPGSGKSLLTTMAKDLGYPTFDADQTVQELYKPAGLIVDWLRQMGKTNCLDGETIKRDNLWPTLNQDPVFKRDLEGVVHKLVYASLQEFWKKANQDRKIITVAEVPLWFETGWPGPSFLATICVTCPKEIRFARLAETRNWSTAKIATIEGWQWSEEQKAAKATLSIANIGSKEDLELKASQLFAKLNAQAKAHNEALAQELLTLLGVPESPSV